MASLAEESKTRQRSTRRRTTSCAHSEACIPCVAPRRHASPDAEAEMCWCTSPRVAYVRISTAHGRSCAHVARAHASRASQRVVELVSQRHGACGGSAAHCGASRRPKHSFAGFARQAAVAHVPKDPFFSQKPRREACVTRGYSGGKLPPLSSLLAYIS